VTTSSSVLNIKVINQRSRSREF